MAINCNPGPLLDNAHCLESCLMEDQLQAISTWLLTQIDGVSPDPGSLLNASKCLSDCLETGQLLNIKAWILVQLAGDSNSNEVLSEAKCFEGCVTARQQDAIQVWLLSQKAGVSDDPLFLFQNSKCLFNCLTWQQQLGIQVYLLAIKAGISPAPGALLESARCFAGCLTEEQANSVITLELCHWSNTGGCPTIILQPDSLPDGTCGAAYSQLITAAGGAAPYTFAVTAGALPGGYSLAADGTLSGTITGTGTFNFTVSATDLNGCTGEKVYDLLIVSATPEASSVTWGDIDTSSVPLPTTITNSFDGTKYGLKIAFDGLASTAEILFELRFSVTCTGCFRIATSKLCANASDALGNVSSADISYDGSKTDFFVDTLFNDAFSLNNYTPAPSTKCSIVYVPSESVTKIYIDVSVSMEGNGSLFTIFYFENFITLTPI